MQGVHGEAEFLRGIFLQQENGRRQNDGNDADGRGEAVIRAGLTEELLVNFHGEGPVALTDEQRCTEICEGPHEHQQRRRQHRGHGQPQNDLPEPFQAAAPQIGGGFHETVVQIAEHTVHVNEHQRIELGGRDQQDSAKAVNASRRQTQGFQQPGQVPGTAHEQYPGVSPDEGCGHTAENTGDEQKFFPFQPIKRVEIGKNDADKQRNQCHGHGDLEAVQNGVVIIGLAEKFYEVVQGKARFLGGEGLLQKRTQGVQEEQQEGQQQCNGNGGPDFKFPALRIHTSAPLSSRTPGSRFRVPSKEKRLIFSALTPRVTSVPLGIMESMEDS